MKSKLQKKELTTAIKKQPKKLDLAAAVKKQPEKRETTATEKTQPKKKETPVVVKKQSQKKEISTAEKKQPQKRKLAVVEKKQPKKEELSVVELGTRYKCYKCGTKFYDLCRSEPLCPSCGVNQNDDEAKVLHKRKRRRRSFYTAKAEPVIFAPEERDDVVEVVNEVDAEYTLDADDIVLEEHGNMDNE
jgi:hypothetical protein